MQTDPQLPKSARQFLIRKEQRRILDQRAVEQIQLARTVAEAKYPPRVFKHVWIFDHSCGHTAYAADALVVGQLNRKPGGKQPAMRDTVWAGKPQKLSWLMEPRKAPL